MLKKKGKTGNVFLPARSRCFFMTIPFRAGIKQKSRDITAQQRRFAAAADAGCLGSYILTASAPDGTPLHAFPTA
jgi:hypothetical protein